MEMLVGVVLLLNPGERADDWEEADESDESDEERDLTILDRKLRCISICSSCCCCCSAELTDAATLRICSGATGTLSRAGLRDGWSNPAAYSSSSIGEDSVRRSLCLCRNSRCSAPRSAM